MLFPAHLQTRELCPQTYSLSLPLEWSQVTHIHTSIKMVRVAMGKCKQPNELNNAIMVTILKLVRFTIQGCPTLQLYWYCINHPVSYFILHYMHARISHMPLDNTALERLKFRCPTSDSYLHVSHQLS